MRPYAGVDYNSTPESTTTHLQWATPCQSRPQPFARVAFIPQLVTLDLASDDPFGLPFVYDELEKDGVRMSSLMKHPAADKRR